MAIVRGNDLVAKALKNEGVHTLFYLMGGPTDGILRESIKLGIHAIDVRHEQAAALAAHAWSRVTGQAGVCMGCSGPGTTNLVTGIANAFTDACPVVALGGSSLWRRHGWEDFQEIDQVAIMQPITKWADRVLEAKKIPEYINTAFRKAFGTRPGPVYLDLPGDVLYAKVEESEVTYPPPAPPMPRNPGDPDLVKKAVELLQKAEHPVIVTGTGIIWSKASSELQEFVELTGIPFFTTPQGRGVIPEDHPMALLAARSLAFREADVVLSIGTRPNWVISHFLPPRFSEGVKLIAVNTNPDDIGHVKPAEIGIVGDAKTVLKQLTEEAQGKLNPKKLASWVDKLRQKDAASQERAESTLNSDQVPIHPLRVCKEIRDFLDRDAIFVVDGHETLNFARQSIRTYVPGHRLNSGSFGCMGVGLPLGIGAKAAKPDKQVVVLHGDGSFGINAINLDTAARHNLPVITVISNNSGWAGGVKGDVIPGRDLAPSTRYDKLAEALGCYGEYVDKPEDIRPALERAAASGKPAVINVITDPYILSHTMDFQPYE